jgi:hypothetical protein
MLLGVLLAWFGFSNPCIQCMLSWLILPMWLLMVIVGVICTALSSWMVVANSDFCSGGTIDSPDATLKQILADRNVTTAEFLGEVTYFYITQCQAPDPWSFIQTYQANLVRFHPCAEKRCRIPGFCHIVMLLTSLLCTFAS